MAQRWMGGALALIGVWMLGACGGGSDGDAGTMDGGVDAPCISAGCDDGLFCNGVELCAPSDPDADEDGCILAEAACAGECDEEMDRCEGCETPDADGDGEPSIACGGADCDDEDANRYPGNIEVCDDAAHDEDCDPTTLGGDSDGDGYSSDDCCNGDTCGQDCDDTVAGINPGASDSCGGGDEDCDGDIDEEPDSVFFRDQDSDNYGVDDDTLAACSQPPGYVARGGDCVDDPFENPNANQFNPGATEICNELDDNCDMQVDEMLSCECTTEGESRDCGFDPTLDGVGVCRLGTQMCSGGTFTVCAGATPPETETCNFDDDDCDGMVDEGVRPTCWLDPDGDGFAVIGAAEMTSTCECPSGQTDVDPEDREDCVEGNPDIHPGATEVCDRIDNDCSSGGGTLTAEDIDDDGHTAEGYTACEGGFPRDDCYDQDNRVFGGQTQYFGEGYCPDGTRPCNGACLGGITFCIPGGSPGPIPATEFDFNCDDVLERRPASSGCSFCMAGFACTGDGVSYSGSPACGSAVTSINCRSGGCSSTCSRSGPSTRPMPCR